jgi:hypothetical protein
MIQRAGTQIVNRYLLEEGAAAAVGAARERADRPD